MTPVENGRLDLGSFEIAPGEARVFSVAVPEQMVRIADSDYVLRAAGGTLTLTVTNTHSGWHALMRGAGTLVGPCWRCLMPATATLTADLSEFNAFGRRTAAAFDDGLDSEYFTDDDVVDVEGMARDALLDDVPNMILCADSCRGLCPVCGIDRNHRTCTCQTDTSDSRWDALRDIAARLDEADGGQHR